MTTTEILSKQTRDAYQWVHKLIDSIPEEKWDETPEILASNVSWQTGHLTLSIYYHTMLVIKGHQEDLLQQIPLRDFTAWYGYNSSPKDSIGKLSATELKNHLKLMQKKSLEIIDSLTPEELKQDLIPGKVEHPVAKNKFEAIDWNVKHIMWHCGQLASLKRTLGHPQKFELKKTENAN